VGGLKWPPPTPPLPEPVGGLKKPPPTPPLPEPVGGANEMGWSVKSAAKDGLV
jgi:hypothetical protein